MKSFLTAACVKFSKAFAADPVGTITAIASTAVAAAPYVAGAAVVAGIGYGVYKLVTK